MKVARVMPLPSDRQSVYMSDDANGVCGNRQFRFWGAGIGGVGQAILLKRVGENVIRSFLASAAVALVLSGCASVQLSMSERKGGSAAQAASAERHELAAALDRLEEQPWSDARADDSGIVGLIFGAGGPSPRAMAEAYLADIDDGTAQTAITVRRDAEETLSDAWNVAHVGRRASSAMQPVRSDLRKVEAAIVETRQCRLVYAETLGMLAKREPSIDRREIRRMKEGFNQAILELGRTADALSARLKESPVSSFASSQASAQ